ncbi:MAG: hypothetical protein ACM3MG_07530 [Bacillota bacterium]
MRIFIPLKNHLNKIYNFIKELEQIPLRNFSDDFESDSKTKPVRAQRSNPVKVEDLRPPRKTE